MDLNVTRLIWISMKPDLLENLGFLPFRKKNFFSKSFWPSSSLLTGLSFYFHYFALVGDSRLTSDHLLVAAQLIDH